MPKPNVDEIVTQGHKRNYIQFGGARPGNPLAYAGHDAQYMTIGGVSAPVAGDIDPIYVPDPHRLKRFRAVGRTASVPDLPTATITMTERHGAIPRQLGNMGCRFTAYEATGLCRDLSDFLAGWSDYVLIYSNGEVTGRDLGDRTAWEDDNQVETALSATFSDIYPVGALSFGEEAAALVSREAIDVVYGSNVQCGDCGPEDDGTKRIYAIARSSGSGSPGLPTEIIYSTDGGATWTELAITGIGATEDPVAIDIVGDKLVVLTRTAGSATIGGYYWSTINPTTGVPGAFTKVTTGFVASKNPNDMYVAGPREVYFVGDGGYIYKSTDITSGVSVLDAGSATTQNLSRIHGAEETLFATGANSAIVKSINRGSTWATTNGGTGTTTATIQALAVLDAYRAWVGTSSGRLFYTKDGGETWTEKTFDGSSAGAVRDIVFPTDEVGYFSHDDASPTARLFSTWNGGQDWTRSAPRIANWPVYDRANRIAVPKDVDGFTAANNVAIAGLAGDGTDGIVLLGVASVR